MTYHKYLSECHHHGDLASHTVAKHDCLVYSKLLKHSFHITSHAVVVHLCHVWTVAMVSHINCYHLVKKEDLDKTKREVFTGTICPIALCRDPSTRHLDR